jgi:hypothetical protein
MVQHGQCGQFATKAPPAAVPDLRAVHADLGDFLSGAMRADDSSHMTVAVDGVFSHGDASAGRVDQRSRVHLVDERYGIPRMIESKEFRCGR